MPQHNSSFVLKPATPILIAICGATATGKSGLAIQLARSFDGVILSADSRQVYREFNIGTAKPSATELELVPHHLIDCCAPTETFTVAEYQTQAQATIQHLHSSHAIPQLPLLVGGTGLYIKSIVRGLKIPRVAPQPELRSQLHTLGQAQCYAFLQQVDAAAAGRIHPHDPTRTLRALEVFYVTGQPISAQQGEYPPSYPILQIGLDCEQGGVDALTQRIATRTQQMMQAGFVEEVELLCDRYGSHLPLLTTLGYQEICQYLGGALSLDQAQELIVLHTRQFAKRQRTWFRANPTIEWFDADSPKLLEQVSDRVQQFIQMT